MLTDEQIAFRDRAVRLSLEIAPRYCLDWRAMAATAILESGWGQSELARCANNYFGVKATSRTSERQTYKLRTSNGYARFRRYESMEDSFHAYGRLVGASPLYRRPREAAREAALEHFVRGVSEVYCPDDPDYSVKIMQIVEMIE